MNPVRIARIIEEQDFTIGEFMIYKPNQGEIKVLKHVLQGNYEPRHLINAEEISGMVREFSFQPDALGKFLYSLLWEKRLNLDGKEQSELATGIKHSGPNDFYFNLLRERQDLFDYKVGRIFKLSPKKN